MCSSDLLYSASMSETSARVKRAVEKLRAAEAMAALVSLQRTNFMHGREAARDVAFNDLGLYWEHDWTADGPVSRAASRPCMKFVRCRLTSAAIASAARSFSTARFTRAEVSDMDAE